MKIRTYIILFIVGLCVCVFNIGWNNETILKVNGETQVIPEEAIRLRILANSDDLKDQWLKRKVRDAIIEEMNRWQVKPETLSEARQFMIEKLPDFKRISEQTVASHGFDTPVKVDYGQVPFPTKLYGNQIYPAGNYEALRITLGNGEGGNWWCVLFPPLCFIDMSNGDAIEKDPSILSASLTNQQPRVEQKEKTVEVRFFLVDKGLEILKNGFQGN